MVSPTRRGPIFVHHIYPRSKLINLEEKQANINNCRVATSLVSLLKSGFVGLFFCDVEIMRHTSSVHNTITFDVPVQNIQNNANVTIIIYLYFSVFSSFPQIIRNILLISR